ncbi:hypothetical protein [Aeromonas phage PVN02]|nr:hypothetical protein [Aeromonas phage PVN02]CAC9972269.1 hypothetical protein PVN02_00002 [Aeromonas phage PVN02]
MDKRPTLSIGRKAKHKGKLQNPIADFKKPKSSHSYASAQFETPVVKRSRAIIRKSDEFWQDEDGEGFLDSLYTPSESVHSDEYLASKTSSEQILAARIAGAGPDAVAAFLHHVEKAKSLGAVNPASFWNSDNPTEKLAYMASRGQINLQSIAAGMRATDKHWGNPIAEGEYESDFSERHAAAAKSRAHHNLQDPTSRMLSVVGAMTVSDQTWKQQVDEPDRITPDSDDKWTEKLQKGAQAIGMIAGAYINADKLEGGEFGPAYAAMHKRLQTVVAKSLSKSISDTGFEMATRGPGRAPVGWTRAMPGIEEIKRSLPVSDRMFINDRVDKLWSEVDGKFESPFTQAIKDLRDVYANHDEGGLARPKNFEHRERQYLLDEMAASGLVDPTQTVISQNPGRDEMYDFKVTTDASELHESAMKSLGATAADLVGDPTLRDQVKRAAAEIAATGTAENTVASTLVPKLTWESLMRDPNAVREDFKFSGRHMYGEGQPAVPLPDREPSKFEQSVPDPGRVRTRGGRATQAKKRPKAPSVVNPGDVIQDAGAAMDAAKIASGDPAAARAKYFAENPHLKHIADDDDKSDPMSAWQRNRRGKVTSSAAIGLVDPEARKGATRRLVEGALTPLDTPADIAAGTLMTKSGDALEPIALDWYRAKFDPNAFEPGMMINRNRAGQATTPDAVTGDGRRNIEVKSRWDRIDPTSKDLTPAQRATLMKNFAQIQHQMYLSGASSTDLIEIIRDPQNPNKPLGGSLKDGENIFKRTIERDDEYIRQNKAEWDKKGRQAAQLANLSQKDQKALAKAVEDGNLQAFEKIAKKRGIEDAEGLAKDMGFGDGGGKGGGRGGKGGGGSGGNYGGFGGRDAPTTVRGAVRAGLSNAGKLGGIANVALAGAEIVWNGANWVNDTGLGLSMAARTAGMRETPFQNARDMLRSSRYLNEKDAVSDLTSITLAKGGLEVGHVDRAVNLVNSTRGAITIGDLRRLDPNDANSISGLIATAEGRMRARGDSEYAIAAQMEQSGLKSLLSAKDAEQGRMSLNTTITNIDRKIEDMAVSLGDLAGKGIDGITGALDSIHGTLLNHFGIDANGDGPLDRLVQPFKNGPAIPSVGSKKMWDNYPVPGRKVENPVEVPTSDVDYGNGPTSAELIQQLNRWSGDGNFLDASETSAAQARFDSMTVQQRMATFENLLNKDSGTLGGGKVEVVLKTEGVQLSVKDEEGRVKSKALLPYEQGQFD